MLVCRAILRQQAQSRKIRLDLQACEVGDTGADAIAELLRADKLAALDISSNRLTETGVASVMNAISSDNALCQLSLRNLFPIADERKKKKKADKDVQQKVISDDTASVMASAIRRSRRLNTIHLCANHFTESGVQIIVEAVAVSSSLQTLDFSHCPHTWPPLALHHLCSALSVTPSPALLHLYLDKCNLGSDDAMRSLSEMLKVNTTLQSLSVCGNAISDAGVIHLAQALRVNTTLQNLQLINSFDTLRKGNPNYTVGEDGGAVAVAEAVAVNCRSALVSLSGVRLNLGACLKVLDLDATHRSSDNKVILQEIKKRRGLV